MRPPRLALLATCLSTVSSFVSGQATGGTFAEVGSTQIGALMMFLGNEKSVYILDKAEGNAAEIKGHSAWGAVWDIATNQATLMDIQTNSFCASGMHLPNGSFATFGGNDAVGTAGLVGATTQKNPDGTGAWDSFYQDFDGRLAIRVVNPCSASDNLAAGADCGWYDNPTVLAMKRHRWYSAVEATGDGTIVILGGFVTGGYVNRWVPDVDPVHENGGAENTYEFYPARDGDAQIVNFLVQNSGLNAYAHTFLMSSGLMLVQANLSTMLWDYNANKETPLPNMPNGVVRVYPASGAVAMLPMTPANNYTQTMIFCGGSDMPAAYYGSYGGPAFDTWKYPASKDCQRLTPEPADGSAPAYIQDDDMLDGRTMGQFILLPNGIAMVINGGKNGTAGYSLGTPDTPLGFMPFGPSLASGEVLTPAFYDPNAPKGSRWSNAGLGSSKIPRLYHSVAILMPDASVLVAGSNPNPDVNLTTVYPTEYRAEIFYPPYFSASVRPAPIGMPNKLSYGGNSFDITIPNSSYTGDANDAADNTTVVVIRGGFTTHAMNMGQRFLQLNNTYTVNNDGSFTLHVAQMPPNPNLFQPGPAFMYVNIHGIPSNGTYLIIGSGAVGTQPTAPASVLPASVRLSGSSNSTGGASTTNKGEDNNGASKSHTSTGLIVGVIVAAVAALAILGAIFGICLARRRRANARAVAPSAAYASTPPPMAMVPPRAAYNSVHSDSSVFVPLNKQSSGWDDAWDPSTASLNAPYKDDNRSASMSFDTQRQSYDPYASAQTGYPTASHAAGPEAHSNYR
ncbi:copper radical oxidase [Pholiota conissans]|uniref:Copper radical oxidase n=1 Tax=Pholiota conissans TaxID=109636 RepID=A0A9P6CZN6_9AGAR|nr:copper radical oxidase [Pholiota conissans]